MPRDVPYPITATELPVALEQKSKNTRAYLMQELEHEIQFFAASSKRQYRADIYDYFEWLKARKQESQWAEREVMYAYIAYLQKGRHLKQSAVNYIVRSPLGCLCRIAGIRLPVKLPKVKAPMLDVASRKSFEGEEIAELIGTAIESGKPAWLNMMALSSIYGLRAGEIRALSKNDVHVNKKTIVVQTEKGGMLREHVVPLPVAPFILPYTYPPMANQKIFDLFNALAAEAGVDRGESHKGLHAVRHGVITIMEDMRDAGGGGRVYDEKDLYVFFRWQGGGMLNAYVTPNYSQVDQRIFKHHPFLSLFV